MLALPAGAAERKFDFSDYPFDEKPPGFRSTVAGQGKPGDWKVILDDVPSLMPPLTPQAPSMAKHAVLAQLARDPADEHFPLLIFDGETYGDFTLTTRFKTVGGAVEQMAGIAFRIQDEKNYYLVRASSLGSTFRFYKVVNGERGPLIGPADITISKRVWHEMAIECDGNHIRCLLDGKELIPMLTDSSFSSGKIGFWTKSDSVSYFADTRVTYTPRQILAQTLVDDALKAYPRLSGLDIYAVRAGGKGPTVVASKNEKEIGQPGGKTEQDVISNGKGYFGRNRSSVTITLPLRDRNGEPIAAVRVVMKSFLGETQDMAIVRAQPVVKEMQSRVQSLEDLLQ